MDLLNLIDIKNPVINPGMFKINEIIQGQSDFGGSSINVQIMAGKVDKKIPNQIPARIRLNVSLCKG